jgi:hypothetical protein
MIQMKFKFEIIAIALFAAALLCSCGKPKCDENIPAIAFKNFQQYRDAQGKLLDSAKIIITFKDCDGDIGLEERDTFPPHDANSRFHHNFVLTYFELEDGEWKEKPSSFKYRLPKLTAEGQSKILEGEIGISIAPEYYNIFSENSDTIKFKVQLFDRALNESNIIETPVILTK